MKHIVQAPLRTLYLFLSAMLLALAANAGDGIPVTVAPVQEQPVYRQVQVTGTVTSPKVARLSPAISGQVLELYADEGDRVEAGAVIMELDPELAGLQVQSARARVAQTQSALEDARRRLREAQRLVTQSNVAKTVVRGLESEVAEDNAALDQARADASYRQALLARHQLRAPFTGVISRKLTELGEWIAVGQGVFELVATDQLRLDFSVTEDYLAELGLDTQVQFSLNAIPGKHFSGRVMAIVPITDPGTRTFLLRVVSEKSNARMLPGMSARATLQIPARYQSLVVPRDAILRYPDGRIVVWTVEDRDGAPVAVENPVQVGQSFDGLVEIKSGLQAGVRVVVKGNEALQKGQRVRIIVGASGE